MSKSHLAGRQIVYVVKIPRILNGGAVEGQTDEQHVHAVLGHTSLTRFALDAEPT